MKVELKHVLLIFFFLIGIEIVILELREEISLIRVLELISICLIALVYYFILRIETREASKLIEKRLDKIGDEFERVEKRLAEELRLLKVEVEELGKFVGILDKVLRKMKKIS
jgi:glucan phosphoethanolaminetransferase (alkaline phosphatase superfamily)